MRDEIEIFCENSKEYKLVKKGIKLSELAEVFNVRLNYPIIGAKVNYITRSLNYDCYKPMKVRFLDITAPSGMKIYVRTLCFILFVAVKKVLPEAHLRIEHPLSKGYFCSLGLGRNIETEEIERIKKEMHNLILADIPILHHEELADEVVRLFQDRGYQDKADLIKTSGKLYSNYYSLGNDVDFFDGVLALSTGYVGLFDIIRFYDGILLRVPNRSNPKDLEPIVKQPAMYEAFKKQIDFLNILGLTNVGQLNTLIKAGKISELVTVAEALQEKSVAAIASEIADEYKKGVRIILVSGPSSSGKTTFTKRLQIQLLTNLLRPLAISLDDYFVDREKTPLDEEGEYDFEAIDALDLSYLNSDLKKLLEGEEIELPRFDFEYGKRKMSGRKIRLKEGALLILEGIHALNPVLTEMIPDSAKYKVYVSALTTISLDDHNWVPTADNRLIRRIIRDYNYRGYSASSTIARWENVRKGEDKWIFPYQENANATFNSAMLYELAALRHKAELILMEVLPNDPEYGEAHRLLNFLSYFMYLNDNELPRTSLLREFLGGSSFIY
ncbi:MAG: nucleoside kinase [Bacteroidales bacterium]|nr:nucleoside kinase [Bacteroidales bacterium]